jgi:glycosyltransferase involved in cell wall biosynthesis
MKGSTTAKPKVAVITRTKNRTLLLERALESVQNQTYQDFVQIVVNDGGDKEQVEKLIASYSKDRLRVIHNPTSIGLTKALNQGIRAVDSEYITMIDDDDTWSKNRLEEVIGFLDQSSAKGVVDVMDRIVEEIQDDRTVRIISKDRWHEGVEAINLYKQCLDNYLSNGCFTYRREVYDELGGYDETLGVAEDWDFGIRFLLKYDVDFLVTPNALSFYHHRPLHEGEIGNSVFAGVDNHKRHLNMLANRYLRRDFASGTIGIGYVMNQLQYEREREQRIQNRSEEYVVRLEGHMNYVAEEVKRSVSRNLTDILQDNFVYNKLIKILKKEKLQ